MRAHDENPKSGETGQALQWNQVNQKLVFPQGGKGALVTCKASDRVAYVWEVHVLPDYFHEPTGNGAGGGGLPNPLIIMPCPKL